MRILSKISFFLVIISSVNTCIKASHINTLYKPLYTFIKSKAEDIIDAAGGNTHCANDLKTLFTDAIFMKKWALEMIDASSKLSSGFLAGNYYLLGSFDQCLDVEEKKENRVINGQYCTVVLLPSTVFKSEFSFLFDSLAFTNFMGINVSYHMIDILKEIKVTYGLCIPQSCSIGNLQKIWDYLEHTFGIPTHAVFVDLMCRSREKPIEPFDVDKYVYGFFGGIIVILLASTWYDITIHQHFEDKKDSYLTAFSLYTNTKKLFSYTKRAGNDGYLECLNGIKVISMLWIVFGHRFMFNMFSMVINSLYAFEWKKEVIGAFIFGGSFAVDTFLTLSGLLLSYGFLKYKSSLAAGKSISYTAFYFFRFLRLSPALLALILFNITIFKNLTDGPTWPLVAKKISNCCLHTWWATLFFFSNHINFNYQCVEQSWYLAVDSQLYLISPIILTGFVKRPWKTCLACLGACIASGVYAFIITANNDYGAMYFEGNRDFYQYIYQSTVTRMPAWLIGCMFGFFIYEYQQVNISKVANMCLWIFSLITMTYLILVHLTFARNNYNPIRSAIFNAGARPLWALALCLIVFSCVKGHGGFINSFLSLPIFQILVKLCYSTYLVHIGVLLYMVGGKKSADYFGSIKSLHDCMGDMVFIFVASTICCLAFESPFIAIGKIMLKRGSVESNLPQIKSSQKKKNRQKNYVVCVYSYKDKKTEKLNKKTN